MIETIAAIVAGIMSGIAAHKARKVQHHVQPNGTNRSLMDLCEDIDRKVDTVLEWQSVHDARHRYLHPEDPWHDRTAEA